MVKGAYYAKYFFRTKTPEVKELGEPRALDLNVVWEFSTFGYSPLVV